MVMFSLCPFEVCGGDLETPTGTLQSPGYPYPYNHRRICEWRITVQEGHLVNLYFDDLDVEQSRQCVFDSVNVSKPITLM